ncbi:MAG TPA: ferredoxin [Acidimicrobiales bacterium]|jgi:ferredoxin|nr:ferredoxin [Acidimicrobiales bacterium]
MDLEIRIDRDRCMGSGNCSFWAPGTFDLDEEGIAQVVDAQANPEDKLFLAADGCPTQAISLWRGGQKVAGG